MEEAGAVLVTLRSRSLLHDLDQLRSDALLDVGEQDGLAVDDRRDALLDLRAGGGRAEEHAEEDALHRRRSLVQQREGRLVDLHLPRLPNLLQKLPLRLGLLLGEGAARDLALDLLQLARPRPD